MVCAWRGAAGPATALPASAGSGVGSGQRLRLRQPGRALSRGGLRCFRRSRAWCAPGTAPRVPQRRHQRRLARASAADSVCACDSQDGRLAGGACAPRPATRRRPARPASRGRAARGALRPDRGSLLDSSARVRRGTWLRVPGLGCSSREPQRAAAAGRGPGADDSSRSSQLLHCRHTSAPVVRAGTGTGITREEALSLSSSLVPGHAQACARSLSFLSSPSPLCPV